MKIKITKAISEEAWYTRLIGEIFEVTGKTRNGKHYYVIHDGITELFCVNKEDCEEVTMEETKEFKVGDEVRVIKGYVGSLKIYQDKTGFIESIDNSRLHPYRIKGFDDTIGYTAKWSADELELVEPKEAVLTKVEALKLCIDGALVVDENSVHPESHVSFDGDDFVYHNGNTGAISKGIGHTYGQWKLWTPPAPPKPKFSIGQFVSDYDGDYVRINSMEYKEDTWEYIVGYGDKDNGTGNRTESELSEVTQ
jgi:hypothetical protein